MKINLAWSVASRISAGSSGNNLNDALAADGRLW